MDGYFTYLWRKYRYLGPTEIWLNMLSPASLQVAPRSIVRSKSHPMKPRSYKISILLRCVAQRRDTWEDVMYQDCQVAILMWSRGNIVTIDTASAPPIQYRRFNIKTVYSRLILHKNIEYWKLAHHQVQERGFEGEGESTDQFWARALEICAERCIQSPASRHCCCLSCGEELELLEGAEAGPQWPHGPGGGHHGGAAGQAAALANLDNDCGGK